MPCAIVRPAIVESALACPSQGWIEGIKVSDPLVLAYGNGTIDGFPMDK